MSSPNMSNDTYRTPGRTVDETEIERAKIHEAAETKRKLIEEREETKRERSRHRSNSPAFTFLILGILAAICVPTTTAVAGWFDMKKQPAGCTDKVRSKSAYNAVDCERPDQMLVDEPGQWVCRCPRSVVKP